MMSDGSDSSDTGNLREIKFLSTIGAKDLLKLGHVSKSGWLKRKTQRGSQRLSIGAIAWRTLYCCIAEGCMYHFESNTSKNPKTAFPLTGYNRLCRVDNQQRDHCFEIQPPLGDNSLKTYMFSCANADDMLDWMRSIYDALLVGNYQLPPDKHVLIKFGLSETEKPVLMESPTSGYTNIDKLKEDKTKKTKPKVDRYNPWGQIFDGSTPKETSGGKMNKETKQKKKPTMESDEHVYVNEAETRQYVNQRGIVDDEEEGDDEVAEEEEETEMEDYLFDSSDGNAARAHLKDKVIQTFLVRNSREQGRKILVVKRRDECKQHVINIREDIYCIEAAAQFRSLNELIEYYKNNELCGSCIGNGYKFYEC
ncbi:uncharacterized protein LOC117339280 [Pecten maximus]|uniref:uncharacterized protein LOC117339280 n=1 Tax=Pecten maximus TaxID=6579 RepID=UPI00145844D4|nr:uncharacterized protein LOC117339280 [Pecten maximus]XP_033756680.1 uncharacterized protein LOC117339280 [Pecten maximus]XP_033756681.1 uncharacterized protein LOC117339280 [Pecten maximus]XP_033756682.1 uncharacterized protein LOC117339280 [Pecten maximus]